MTPQNHFVHSSAREKLLEHLFVGEVLRCLWRHGEIGIEVLRSEVDSSGYDLVLESNGVLRHIQLKSSYRGAKTRNVTVNSALARKPSGCVVWMFFDPTTVDLGPFLWFGAAPGDPLPSLGNRLGKHTKGDKTGKKGVRPNIRVLDKARFRNLDSINDVVRNLFGEQ